MDLFFFDGEIKDNDWSFTEVTNKPNMDISLDVIYYVFGYDDLTQEEYDQHYKEKVKNAFYAGASFVLGTSTGADYLTQKHLVELINEDKRKNERVTLFYYGVKPIVKPLRSFCECYGWLDQYQILNEMACESDQHIYYLRSADEKRKLYGNKYHPTDFDFVQDVLDIISEVTVSDSDND